MRPAMANLVLEVPYLTPNWEYLCIFEDIWWYLHIYLNIFDTQLWIFEDIFEDIYTYTWTYFTPNWEYVSIGKWMTNYIWICLWTYFLNISDTQIKYDMIPGRGRIRLTPWWRGRGRNSAKVETWSWRWLWWSSWRWWWLRWGECNVFQSRRHKKFNISGLKTHLTAKKETNWKEWKTLSSQQMLY